MDVMGTLDLGVLETTETDFTVNVNKFIDKFVVLISKTVLGLDEEQWATYAFRVLGMLLGSVRCYRRDHLFMQTKRVFKLTGLIS